MSYNFDRLKVHIVSMSKAKTFEAAVEEWVLDSIEVSDEFDSCPCGQDIKEHCYLRNRLTGRMTYVGNVCVNRFLGIKTGSLFDGLRRIKENPTANPNLAVIEYAESKGYLFEKEPEFLRSTARTRILSPAQKRWKEKINHRIVSGVVVTRRTVR